MRPVLRPDQDYDQDGVFTGCMMPPPSTGDEIKVFYSSVKRVPFHWTELPYPHNAAGIAAATSRDGGETWQKSTQNPILRGEPDGVDVTGFRDPYMSTWPELDTVRGKNEHSIYALVSGGIAGVGPTSLLYQVDPQNTEAWNYLGPLIDVAERLQTSAKWGVNMGMNWECVNFMTLSSGSASQHFLLVGAEGDVERDYIKQQRLSPDLSPRTVRQQLWISGDLVSETSNVKFQHRHSGLLDHGSYYAANSFVDPSTGRRIVHGWIPEEDCTASHAKDKGWNGALALPREVFLLALQNVTRALQSPLSSITSMEQRLDPNQGTSTLYTLGIRPISEVSQYRKTSLAYYNFTDITPPNPSHSTPSSTSFQHLLLKTTSPTFELHATLRLPSTFQPSTTNLKSFGFHIRHNPTLQPHRIIRTSISFSPTQEILTIDRSHSTPFENINTCPEQGAFTLFRLRDPVSGEESWEELRLRVFSDGDVLEVFANERFALGTMVYSDTDADHGRGAEGRENSGVSAFVEMEEGEGVGKKGVGDGVVFEKVEVWDGLNGLKSCVVEGA